MLVGWAGLVHHIMIMNARPIQLSRDQVEPNGPKMTQIQLFFIFIFYLFEPKYQICCYTLPIGSILPFYYSFFQAIQLSRNQLVGLFPQINKFCYLNLRVSLKRRKINGGVGG